MNTQKAAYWLALFVFALALRSEYRAGGFATLHRAANVAGSELCLLAARAGRSLAFARAFGDAWDDRFVAQTDAAIARHQAELDRVVAIRQAEIARRLALHQAELNRVEQTMNMRVVMDRAQLERPRQLDHMRFSFNEGTNHHTVVVCPRTRPRIAIRADGDVPDFDLDTDPQ